MQSLDPTNPTNLTNFPTSPLSSDLNMATIATLYSDVLHAMHELAETCYRQGRLDEAVTVLRQSLPLLEASDVAPGVVIETLLLHGRLMIARYAHLLQDDEQLRPTLLRAKTLADSLGDVYSIATAMQLLGEASYYRLLWQGEGVFADIQTYFQQARELREQVADMPGLSVTWLFCGMVAERQRQSELAETCYQKSLFFAEQSRSPLDEAEVLQHLGGYALARNDYEEAERCLLRSLKLCEESGYRVLLPTAQLALGYVCEARGEFVRAFTLYQSAYTAAATMGLLRSEVFALLSMGDICNVQGNPTAAYEHYAQAQAVAQIRNFVAGLNAARARLTDMAAANQIAQSTTLPPVANQ